jgi:hypothetical protein
MKSTSSTKLSLPIIHGSSTGCHVATALTCVCVWAIWKFCTIRCRWSQRLHFQWLGTVHLLRWTCIWQTLPKKCLLSAISLYGEEDSCKKYGSAIQRTCAALVYKCWLHHGVHSETDLPTSISKCCSFSVQTNLISGQCELWLLRLLNALHLLCLAVHEICSERSLIFISLFSQFTTASGGNTRCEYTKLKQLYYSSMHAF